MHSAVARREGGGEIADREGLAVDPDFGGQRARLAGHAERDRQQFRRRPSLDSLDRSWSIWNVLVQQLPFAKRVTVSGAPPNQSVGENMDKWGGYLASAENPHLKFFNGQRG